MAVKPIPDGYPSVTPYPCPYFTYPMPSTRLVVNQFYGDRNGSLEDPFGHHWTISTHVEDVSTTEMVKRMAELPAHG